MSCLAPAALIPLIAAWSFASTSCVGCTREHDQHTSRDAVGDPTYHVMRLVVDPEDDLGVVNESACKLLPELAELLGGRCGRIGGVPDYLYVSYDQS
jgi:hypothetical protein